MTDDPLADLANELLSRYAYLKRNGSSRGESAEYVQNALKKRGLVAGDFVQQVVYQIEHPIARPVAQDISAGVKLAPIAIDVSKVKALVALMVNLESTRPKGVPEGLLFVEAHALGLTDEQLVPLVHHLVDEGELEYEDRGPNARFWKQA